MSVKVKLMGREADQSLKVPRLRVDGAVPLHIRVYAIPLIGDKRVSTQNLAFFIYCYRKKNVCRCTFNRCSVITQFAELAAGEQLCRRCTPKIIALKTFNKSLSWKKNHRFWVVTLLCCDIFVLWHCWVVTLVLWHCCVVWHCWVVTLVLCCVGVGVVTFLCCDTCVVTVLCCDTVVLWHCWVVTLVTVLRCDTVVGN